MTPIKETNEIMARKMPPHWQAYMARLSDIPPPNAIITIMPSEARQSRVTQNLTFLGIRTPFSEKIYNFSLCFDLF